MDAVLQNFRRSFEPSTPFFHSLSLDPPTTTEKLYRWAYRYSTLEDNIRTATQTFMIISKPVKSSKLARKKPFESRNGRADESDPMISHKKEGAPVVHPLEHLIREATAPHSRLAKFQMAYTDLDGSLSEKPIRAVRLS